MDSENRSRNKRRPREDPCMICGHYHDYEGGVPCSICGHVMAATEKKQVEAVFPANIIPGFLYLGSYDTASRSALLKTLGITHILNTVPTCQTLFKNTFTYHTVSSSPPSYEECFNFIEETQKVPDTKILVYCMSGVSRSPAVVIAYLMKARGWRLAESYKWVKDKRPTVAISADETRRLIELEQQLYNSCSAPMGLAALDSACGAFPVDSCIMPSAQHQQQQVPGQAPVFGAVEQQGAWSMSPQPVAPSFVFGSPGAANNTFQQDQPAANFCFGSTSSRPGNEMEM